MSRVRLLATPALAAALVTTAVLAQAPPSPVPVDEAPAALRPAIARAQVAAKALQATLQTRLVEVLPTTGPVAAIDICRREAYAVAAEVGMQQGISLGRTSHKLRNPNNAPKPWAASVVAANAGNEYVDANVYVVDSGSKVGVLQPIPMGDTCSLCHGTKSSDAGGRGGRARAAYPTDEATGFTTGDVRGWIGGGAEEVASPELCLRTDRTWPPVLT